MAKNCSPSKRDTKRISDSLHSHSLEKLVQLYLNEEQECDYSSKKETYKKGHELYLNSLQDKLDFICGEHNDEERRKSHRYKYNGHQIHLQSYHADKEIVDDMLSKFEDLEKYDISDFDKLYEEVKKKAVSYFGPTCIYDFSLRYGWNQSPRIEPREYVYVHAHPLTSAKHLAQLGHINSKVKNSTYRIPINDFSEKIRKPGMTAQDIEHFLCVFRDEILKLTN